MKEKIAKWLNEQGFPLEMKVAKIFQENGFSVSSSIFYKDTSGGKAREIDVIAERGILLDHHIIFTISFIVECKYSLDKPWILFRSNNNRGKKILTNYDNASYYGAVTLLEIGNTSVCTENELFQIPEYPYYGVRRAFDNGKDMPFTALMEVCKGLLAQKEYVDSFYSKPNTYNISLFFPLIIVDGRLYETFLDNASQLNVQEIDSGILFLNSPDLNNERFYVRIIDFGKFGDQIKLLSKAARNMMESVKDKIPKTIEIMLRDREKNSK